MLPAENAFDAGREFIDANLKGNFQKAAFYMVADEKNKQFLAIAEKDYRQKDKEGRQELRTASINLEKVEDLDQSQSIIYFSNSFDKKPQKIKVIKTNQGWLVDYKFSFSTP
ncbi:MAG: hypothetical protein B7Y15_14070 [Bacteroidetes bacterium 24-39-8]|nr:MAG: hypothetical protein B7Y15_14070 [Bacteroidetes bacterium 24-39-8]HQS54899.1 hypothetical protein [Sediminibacterium sp.]